MGGGGGWGGREVTLCDNRGMGQGEDSTDVAAPEAGAVLRAAVGEGPVQGAPLGRQQLALGSLLRKDGWWQ